MNTTTDPNNDRQYRRPRAWLNAKRAFGEDTRIGRLMRRVETEQSTDVRTVLDAALRHWLDASTNERQAMVAATGGIDPLDMRFAGVAPVELCGVPYRIRLLRGRLIREEKDVAGILNEEDRIITLPWDGDPYDLAFCALTVVGYARDEADSK